MGPATGELHGATTKEVDRTQGAGQSLTRSASRAILGGEGLPQPGQPWDAPGWDPLLSGGSGLEDQLVESGERLRQLNALTSNFTGDRDQGSETQLSRVAANHGRPDLAKKYAPPVHDPGCGSLCDMGNALEDQATEQLQQLCMCRSAEQAGLRALGFAEGMTSIGVPFTDVEIPSQLQLIRYRTGFHVDEEDPSYQEGQDIADVVSLLELYRGGTKLLEYSTRGLPMPQELP